jgi:hypothetical protein
VNPNLTFIAVVLDRSASMGPLKSDTIGGFNTFLEEQKKTPGDALFTVAQFANPGDYRLTADATPIAAVEPLTDATYSPTGGSTALLDAIGLTIDTVGTKLKAMPEAERPCRVLIMIQTDGAENSSREYTRARIQEMIKHQREKYDWDFAFVGASEQSLAQAQTYGFQAKDMAQYSASPEGTHQVMRNMSVQTTSYRTGEKTKGGIKRGIFAPDDDGDLQPS